MLIPREFKTLVRPDYHPAKRGDWEIKLAPKSRHSKVLAYFQNDVPMPRQNWALFQQNRVWMSMTPMELESQGYHSRMAHGHVMVAGLGMGALVYNLLQFNSKVTHITVVDMNPFIGELLTEATTWFRPSSQLTLEIADARTYKPTQPVDVLLVDIWPKLGQEEAEADTRQIQANVQAKEVAWWGQEIDFISFVANDPARSGIPTPDDIINFQKHLGFKTLGMSHPAYPELAYVAAVGFSMAIRQAQNLGAMRRRIALNLQFATSPHAS